ncbi:3-phosphoshikimate 1-carboxyvinyltransferase [Candidatus Parcubacteria bacterium]|nr:3-phosphoshikimate 1-carboxyvinyltransferase [Candidatus Parcubacteria bacterium]
MEAIIQKSKIYGEIKAPASKSYTHRALICAALAKGKSKIISPLISDDTGATLDVLKKIGISVKKKKEIWEVKGGNFSVPKQDLFCRESGTTFRFMIAICSLIKGKCQLTGEISLLKRPIKPLINALQNLGVDCEEKISSVVVENNFVGGKTKIKGDISSQFISALLLIAPFSQKQTELKLTTVLESKPYVLMTIDVQKKFGVKVKHSNNLRKFLIQKQRYKPCNYFVESDWSSAAFLLAIGVLAGKTEVKNLNIKSAQADKEIINILEKMGAKIKTRKNAVIAEKSKLKSIKIDISDCPDIFPIICVLCSQAKGKSEISGIKRLVLKESNRIKEMEKGLARMMIKTKTRNNKFIIWGSKPRGAVISSIDHRIAMAFGVLGLVAEERTIIKNAECVSKSFPEFWEHLIYLKANINVN